MQKKEYTAPELKDLGNLKDLTKNSWIGDNFDGAYPEFGPEIFGS